MKRFIVYTARINYDIDNVTYYQLNRFDNDAKPYYDITNLLLDNVTKNGTHVKKFKEYDEWVTKRNRTFTLYMKNFFIVTNSMLASNVKQEFNNFIVFRQDGLDKIYINLLLTEGIEQQRYAIQYCNNDEVNVKMLACDLLHNQSIIKLKNRKILEYILSGRTDDLEELTQ